jgi:hypothetical protein
MPVFLAALGGMFLNIAGSLVLRVITSLGIGVVAYKGMSVTLDWLRAEVVSSAAGLPAEMLGMMAAMKVGASISIVFSAMLARMLITGMSGDTVKRWVTK